MFLGRGLVLGCTYRRMVPILNDSVRKHTCSVSLLALLNTDKMGENFIYNSLHPIPHSPLSPSLGQLEMNHTSCMTPGHVLRLTHGGVCPSQQGFLSNLCSTVLKNKQTKWTPLSHLPSPPPER